MGFGCDVKVKNIDGYINPRVADPTKRLPVFEEVSAALSVQPVPLAVPEKPTSAAQVAAELTLLAFLLPSCRHAWNHAYIAAFSFHI